jgi:hypothetical protein
VDKLREILRDEFVDQLITDELQWQLENSDMDASLTSAMHTVIAYYSVAGTYMEGAYDAE